MLPVIVLWLLWQASNRTRAASGGDVLNPWNGQRIAPALGGGIADPWGASTAPRTPARQTPAAARATAAANSKLSWLLGANDAQAAQSKAKQQLDSAIVALIATAPLHYTQAPLMIQSAGPGKWYAILDVDNDTARGRLRAELGRTPGVTLPT